MPGQKNMLSFLNRLQCLRWVDRCSNTPHIKPYSVAQHSFYMALYGLLFARLENERLGHNYYNLEKVMSRALVHDLEESLTGDILFPLHNDHLDFKEKLDSIRLDIVNNLLFEELPKTVSKSFICDWKNSKDNSPEGILIACMDKFEIIIYCLTEFKLGNTSMFQIYNNAVRIVRKEFKIKSVLEVIDKIERRLLKNSDIKIEV